MATHLQTESVETDASTTALMIERADTQLAALAHERVTLQERIPTAQAEMDAAQQEVMAEEQNAAERQATYRAIERDVALARTSVSLADGSPDMPTLVTRLERLEQQRDQAELDTVEAMHAAESARTRAQTLHRERTNEIAQARVRLDAIATEEDDLEQVRADAHRRRGEQLLEAAQLQVGRRIVAYHRIDAQLQDAKAAWDAAQDEAAATLADWPDLAAPFQRPPEPEPLTLTQEWAQRWIALAEWIQDAGRDLAGHRVVFNGERTPLEDVLTISAVTWDALTGAMTGYVNPTKTGPGSYWSRRLETAHRIVSGELATRHAAD